MNMLKIYNTLSRKKEEFKPLKAPTVNMYTCGVTVYDDCHIGHGRSLYVFEVIRNFLKFSGFKVNFIRNITDIDDKIINKARDWSKSQNISLEEAFSKIKNTYIKNYYTELENLQISKADYEPKATENIKPMQEFISRLIDRGYAYEQKGSVYFSVRKFTDYGKLSGKKIEDLISGGRIEVDTEKKDPLDFVLWKPAKPEEPSWESPWGRGRPGWHIECSMMSKKYLNTSTLDIHGGGLDLIFPHHENEIAQSEAETGKQFAKYWIHHGMITIDKKKMSKSLKNFLKLNKALDKYGPNVLKIFYLSSHYRSPLDFNEATIKESQRIAQRITEFANRLAFYQTKIDLSNLASKELSDIHEKFNRAMQDDFNMPLGFSSVFDLIRTVNSHWNENDNNQLFFRQAKAILFEILNVFAIKIKQKTIDEKDIREKIELRKKLRADKKFNEADRIRDELLEKGIVLEDMPSGETRWIHRDYTDD